MNELKPFMQMPLIEIQVSGGRFVEQICFKEKTSGPRLSFEDKSGSFFLILQSRALFEVIG